jgi:hypothetical protein
MAPIVSTFDSDLPLPDRSAAVAAVLRRRGWPPEREGALVGPLLEDVLMILGAGGGVQEVAVYLRNSDAAEPTASERSAEEYASVAHAVVAAARRP